jgi:hypothetical protein
MSRAQLVPCVIVPDVMRGVRGVPEPANSVRPRDPLLLERLDRALQKRRADRIAVDDHGGESIEQEIRRTAQRWRRTAGGSRNLAYANVSSEPSDEQRRDERLEVRVPGERRVVRLEFACSIQEQRWRVAPVARPERDTSSEEVDVCALQVVERRRFERRERPQGRLARSCLLFDFGGAKSTCDA